MYELLDDFIFGIFFCSHVYWSLWPNSQLMQCFCDGWPFVWIRWSTHDIDAKTQYKHNKRNNSSNGISTSKCHIITMRKLYSYDNVNILTFWIVFILCVAGCCVVGVICFFICRWNFTHVQTFNWPRRVAHEDSLSWPIRMNKNRKKKKKNWNTSLQSSWVVMYFTSQ